MRASEQDLTLALQGRREVRVRAAKSWAATTRKPEMRYAQVNVQRLARAMHSLSGLARATSERPLLPARIIRVVWDMYCGAHSSRGGRRYWAALRFKSRIAHIGQGGSRAKSWHLSNIGESCRPCLRVVTRRIVTLGDSRLDLVSARTAAKGLLSQMYQVSRT